MNSNMLTKFDKTIGDLLKFMQYATYGQNLSNFRMNANMLPRLDKTTADLVKFMPHVRYGQYMFIFHTYSCSADKT